ncbi:hypothetical protein JTB14_033901 [Gonioctena quinquepunctata]|nr:hypothetical protein JTB14_033901 [Gonioctena quinquepunctata]
MKYVLCTNETIKKQNYGIKFELRNIKQELSSQIEELKEENTYLKEEVEKLMARVLTSERKQKKYNLIFYGLEKEDNQLADIQYIIKIINEKCEVSCKYHNLRTCYRIGQKLEGQKTRPVLVEFIYHHQIDAIFEKVYNLVHIFI